MVIILQIRNWIWVIFHTCVWKMANLKASQKCSWFNSFQMSSVCIINDYFEQKRTSNGAILQFLHHIPLSFEIIIVPRFHMRPFLRWFEEIMLGLRGSALITLTRGGGEIIAANFLLMCPLLYNDTKCSISQWLHEFVITTYRFPSVSWLREQHTVLTTAPGPITRCGIVSSLPAATLPNELQLSPMGSVFHSAISQRSILHLLP